MLLGIVCGYGAFCSMDSNAAGNSPISHHALSSTGDIAFDFEDDNDVRFYTSDLKNLQTDIDVQAEYVTEKNTLLTTNINSLKTEVVNGKGSLVTKVNAKTGKTTLSGTPTFAQINSSIDTVYSTGFAAGVSASKLVRVGTGAGTYNLSGYSGYKNFVVGKQIVVSCYVSGEVRGHHNCSGCGSSKDSLSPDISYNASTGILTVSNGYYHIENDDDDEIYFTLQAICNGVYVAVN
jgi:hypothetical protein